MATQQSRAGKGRIAPPFRENRGPISGAAAATEERDELYGLVSVLYHALQEAQTYAQYVEDARRSGDDELSEFFEECQDEEVDRADRAKELLATRLDAFTEPDDDEDEVAGEREDEDEEEAGELAEKR